MTELAIRVRDLKKRFPGRNGPVEAVAGLDLEVARGECFGLLGPNGAGKTTTIEILEGLTPPTSGDVEVLGMRWERNEHALRSRIGVTLQETKYSEKTTVLELARLFRSFFDEGADPKDVLARVGLTSKAGAYVETLSGGQRQRLAVALALVGEPELLFLDEPTTGLDPQSRRRLWEVVQDAQEQGRTILLTTHYMDEAERLCDRIAIIDHGKVIALGSPAELIARIGGEHVIEFAVGGDSPAPPAESYRDLPSVIASRAEADGFALTVHHPHLAVPALLKLLEDQARPLARLATRQVSLEDVFVVLTGRHLRDEDAPPEAEPEGQE
jgi:ABC-2 type transport system ATP-binding protein